MCTLYERIDFLCKQKGITGAKMCRDLGFSKSMMTDLKMGRKKGVNADTAQKIAVYFGVTVSFLLGETEKISTDEISEGEKQDILDEVDVAFYGDYKELTDDDKETVRDMVRIMRERRLKK